MGFRLGLEHVLKVNLLFAELRRGGDGVFVRYERVGSGRVDHHDAYLFELARENVDDFLLLSLVGVDEVLLAFACRGARLRVSPDGGRQRHGSQGPKQQCGWRPRYISGFAEAVCWRPIRATGPRDAQKINPVN